MLNVINKIDTQQKQLIVLSIIDLVSNIFMSEPEIDHQLNGYKYSFNRVNPYVNINNQQQKTAQINPIDAQKFNKKKQIKENSYFYQQQKKSTCKTNEQKLHIENEQQINKKLISKTGSSNTISKYNTKTSTKQNFYNQVHQNQKNRMLVDLYLRKTKFNRIKSFSRGSSQLKQKLSKINKSSLPIQSLYTSNEKVIHSNEKSIPSNDKSISNNQKSISNNQKLVKQQKAPSQTPSQLKVSRKRLSKSSIKSKSFHQLSIQKFMVYSGSEYKLDQSSNIKSERKISKKKQQTPNERKSLFRKINLRLNTQVPSTTEIGGNFCVDYFFGNSVQSARNNPNPSNIRNIIGALDYKTPKNNLNSKAIFQSRKVGKKGPLKIKLFSEEEQKSLITQFYNNQK